MSATAELGDDAAYRRPMQNHAFDASMLVRPLLDIDFDVSMPFL
jgi:hypothetical protein